MMMIAGFEREDLSLRASFPEPHSYPISFPEVIEQKNEEKAE